MSRNFPTCRSLPLALAVMPGLLCAWYVLTFGVNVPYYDDWSLVPLLERVAEGSFDIADLFTDQSGHRLALPKLIMLILAQLTRWDLRAEMLLSVALLALVAGLLYAIFRDVTELGAGSASLWLFIPVCWLVFSLRQWETLLLGFGLTHTLTVSSFVLSVYCLHRCARQPAFLAAAILAGLACSYSMLMGCLVWPIGVAQLLLQPARRRWDILIWSAAGSLVLAVYFAGFTLRGRFASSPIEVAVYALVMLGAPLALGQGVISGDSRLVSSVDYYAVGLTGGLLAAAMGAAALDRAQRRALGSGAACLSLAAYATGTAVLSGVGRVGYGLENAVASRYTPHTFLLVIAVYMLAVSRGSASRYKSALLGGWTVLVLLSCVVSTVSELSVGPYRRASLERWAAVVKTVESRADEELENPHFPPSLIRAYCKALRRLGFSVFVKARPMSWEDGVTSEVGVRALKGAEGRPGTYSRPEFWCEGRCDGG